MDFGAIFGNALRSAFGPDAAVYALAAIGLNLHFGYTGLLNFGQVGFMLVAAYGVAITVATYGLSIWLGIAIGLAACVVLAIALGVPTLRLRADYFAITTIAVAEILRFVMRSSPLRDFSGGVFGLQDIAGGFTRLNPFPGGRFGFGQLKYSSQTLWAMAVAWGLVALCTLLIFLLVRSPWGRVIRSIREDEDAARSLGKNVVSFKMQSLVIGGLIAGLGGIMAALNAGTVNADAFQPNVTFFAYTILILGGAASTFGPIAGSVIFWFLISATDATLRQASQNDLLPGFLGSSDAVGAISLIIVGLGLMLLMVFRPQGIFGNRREMVLDV